MDFRGKHNSAHNKGAEEGRWSADSRRRGTARTHTHLAWQVLPVRGTPVVLVSMGKGMVGVPQTMWE